MAAVRMTHKEAGMMVDNIFALVRSGIVRLHPNDTVIVAALKAGVKNEKDATIVGEVAEFAVYFAAYYGHDITDIG